MQLWKSQRTANLARLVSVSIRFHYQTIGKDIIASYFRRGQRVVQDFDYDADVHLDNCPMRPVPEKDKGIDTCINKQYVRGWNACIDAIVGE